jgi:hypothetical protein
VSLLAVLFLSDVSRAERVITAKGSAAGPVTLIVEPNPVGFQTFDVTGEGSAIGRHRNLGATYFNIDTGEVFGSFSATTADQETIDGSFVGFFFPVSETEIGYITEVTWESGTGRFAGVSGTANVIAFQSLVTNITWYDYEGVFILPLATRRAMGSRA